MPITFDKANQPYRNYDLVGYQIEDYESAVAEDAALTAAFEEFQKNGGGKDGSFVNGGFEFPDGRRTVFPLDVFEVNMAMERAQKQIGSLAIPATADALEQYSHIDPAGHYSEVDLAMSDRLLRIRAAAEQAAPENKAFAMQALEAIAGNPPRNKLAKTFGEMRNESQQIRQMDRACQLVRTESAFESLRAERNSLAEKHGSIIACDGMLQGLEAVVGLRKEPLSNAVKDSYQRVFETPITDELLANATKRGKATPAVALNFGNFDNMSIAVNAVKPENWGKTLGNIPKEMTPEDTRRVMGKYAAATADTAISPLFEGMESAMIGDRTNTPNRGSLITVDGMTVKEMIAERYAAMQQAKGQSVRDSEYQAFYEKNFKQLTNEFVSAGLMAGKRVEMFVPDGVTGEISKEPTQIVKQGYEPTPMKEVTMNAWERFFSRRGFYKEKTAELNEYRRVMDSRERVQCNHNAELNGERACSSAHVKNIYFAQGLEERNLCNANEKIDYRGLTVGPEKNNFPLERSACTNACIARLLMEGHSVEDVYDNSKLRTEKAAMGQEYLRRAEAGDKKWLAESYLKGHEIIGKELETRMAGRVPTSAAALGDDYHTIRSLAVSGFDISQERAKLKPECKEFVETIYPEMNETQVNNHLDKLHNMCHSMALVTDSLDKSLAGRAAMTKPGLTSKETLQAVGNLIIGKQADKVITNLIAEKPGSTIFDCDCVTLGRIANTGLLSASAMSPTLSQMNTPAERAMLLKTIDHPDFLQKSGYAMGFMTGRDGKKVDCIGIKNKEMVSEFADNIKKKTEHLERAKDKSEAGMEKKTQKLEEKSKQENVKAKSEGPSRKK